MRSFYQKLIDYNRKVNWTLLLFLILLLNVKLVVKLAAFIIIFFSRYRRVSFKEIIGQRQLYFYFALIGIIVINYLSGVKQASLPSTISAAFSISLWMICAAASYYLYQIVQKEEKEKLYNTVTFFFILHTGTVFLNLLRIMIECGTLNPYTYKGLNAKYYISTGDFISGITFDSPVTTAMISAFGVIYLLYRRHFILSLAAMASLLLIASNLTNILLVLVLFFIFLFRSDKTQKSFVVVQLSFLIIFILKVSPQNSEYVGRFAYKVLGLTYDLPKKIESLDLIKASSDSLLTPREKQKKTAVLYLDSLSAEKARNKTIAEKYAGGYDIITRKIILLKKRIENNDSFHQYKEAGTVANKINKYKQFLEEHYPITQRDSLQKLYDWNKPGKWIAAQQLVHFFKEHPGNLLLGAGAGNLSSRVAFKTTSLGIAGSYPVKFSYMHPWFLENHLYLYLYYHSQGQTKHAAENTPDSTYNQLAGEYGIAGLLVFLFLYIGYFARHKKKFSFGLPILLLLLGAFFTEYWFEQLSVVILFELLLFLDMKTGDQTFMEEKSL
jgi:hypothetical protein